MSAAQNQKHQVERRVLLVEDDADLSRTLVEVLEQEGLDVVPTVNGWEALEYLRRETPPDVILLDLCMPVMDGWQFRLLQKAHPAFSEVPVVAMSGDRTAKAAAIDSDAFLGKPFSMQQLRITIDQVVDRRARQRAQRARNERTACLAILAADVAFEINTPIASVLANLDYVRREVQRRASLEDADALAAGNDTEASANDARMRADEGAAAAPLRDVLAALDDVARGIKRVREVAREMQSHARQEDERAVPADVTQAVDAAVALARGDGRLIATDCGPTPLVLVNGNRLGLSLLALIVFVAQRSAPRGRDVSINLSTSTDDAGWAVLEIVGTAASGEPPRAMNQAEQGAADLSLLVCQRILAELGGEMQIDAHEAQPRADPPAERRITALLRFPPATA